MEYVEGESLDHIFARRKKLPWEEVVEIGIHLCAALQHAHDQGIIHRDLKPSNLMILKDGVVKLTDFGIAKDTDVTALTNANSTVGTAAYMSPEQCRGARDIGHKSDLYSMGIMFYRIAHGQEAVRRRDADGGVFAAREQSRLQAARRDRDGDADLVERARRAIDGKGNRETAAEREGGRRFVATDQGKGRRPANVGKDAAPKRKKERAAKIRRTVDDDKDGASAMMGMRKKKAVEPPFYTKGWFTLAGGFRCRAVARCVFLFRLFYARRMRRRCTHSSAKAKQRRQRGARRADRRFSAHLSDARKVGANARLGGQYDFELLERQMLNRRNKSFKTEGIDEILWREALDDEDAGNFAEAAKQWDELAKRKKNADPENTPGA